MWKDQSRLPRRSADRYVKAVASTHRATVSPSPRCLRPPTDHADGQCLHPVWKADPRGISAGSVPRMCVWQVSRRRLGNHSRGPRFATNATDTRWTATEGAFESWLEQPDPEQDQAPTTFIEQYASETKATHSFAAAAEKFPTMKIYEWASVLPSGRSQTEA